MGTLFPDSDEYPDHHPVPSPLSKLTINGVGMPLAVATSLCGLCPALEHHDDAPHHDTVPGCPPCAAVERDWQYVGHSVLQQ